MIERIYEILYAHYGKQGWWPLRDIGYHPGDYSFPKTKEQQFEIMAGCILTQNTSWKQAEKALENIPVRPEAILSYPNIPSAIRPAGYYNQKAARLKRLARWLLNKPDGDLRKSLLSIKGVGPETADSILLYAFKRSEFVIDSYTKRIFSHLGLCDENISYDDLKRKFEENLDQSVRIFQEYHALIVRHAKKNYRKKPYEDPLIRL